MMRLIGTLVCKTGTTAQRQAYTPEQGELVVDTDLNALYLGDGATVGGLGPFLLSPMSSDLDLAAHSLVNYTDELAAVAYSSTNSNYALDLSAGRFFQISLTANGAIALSNVPASGVTSITLQLTQDATGSRTVTWPAGTKWGGGSAPTLSTAANAIDLVTLVTPDGGTTWFGFMAGEGMA